MQSFINKIFGGKKDQIIIVSGLPRSGTSMMMQMLEQGGIPVVTDNTRKPDDDNPRGYYELKKVKKIKEDATWLNNCHRKAFKMVSRLLYHLPPDKNYKIIFMRREMSEMLASQKAMLRRQGNSIAEHTDEEMAVAFSEHLQKIENWLARKNNMDVIYIKFSDVIADPIRYAREMNSFLGGGLVIEKMANVVDTSLYRQRN